MDKVDIDLKEYFIGQGGGYGGQAGGAVAPGNWAGTYSSPQTSNRLNLHPDTGITSYMQGNTIVRNALPDTILPQDLQGTPYDPDEIRLGLRSEMKKQEFPDKTKAKQTVMDNLAKNPRFYSDLLQYMNSDKGEIMENIDPEQLKMGIEIEKEHTDDDALASKIAMDHLKEDPMYYSKLKAAGLGHDEPTNQSTTVAVPASNVSTVSFTIPAQCAEPSQKPLSSSGMGVDGQPKPLSSTNIKAPEMNKVGPNTIGTKKTPTMGIPADPLNHYATKIQSTIKWQKIP